MIAMLMLRDGDLQRPRIDAGLSRCSSEFGKGQEFGLIAFDHDGARSSGV